MSASLPPQYYGFGVFLIKTGDVEPGPHQVTTTMELSAGGYTFLRGSMTFSVQADSCTVPADAGSKTVNMGHVARDAIRPPGVTGAPLSAFHIPLTQCAIGSALSNMVNIKFDGAAGSASVGPEQGVLGLKNGATAQGIGIQILRENGSTPVPLGVFTPAAPVRPGEMTLDFQARYVQTQPVTLSGSANAAVNFTLSYK
ncbi:fimbrial protein [Pantoea sp. 1.19]|uniref:fimbrial protein n=1 Tax=Pantoea sp. 1.19 TaxID=1925589 RepID=UPI000948A16A|nr:fimbrial protein [Pantoea sp. 1.19]